MQLYQESTRQEHVQRAYSALLHYLTELKTVLQRISDRKHFLGYTEHSYFPFTRADFLRTHKLRFGVVLNHTQMRFTLCLMGQNQVTKDQHWVLFHTSRWARGRQQVHPYAMMTASLPETIDCNHRRSTATTTPSNTKTPSSRIECELTTISVKSESFVETDG
ncbi:DUF7000 family protein [Bifidobacterium crudilactis]|uniref:DUF7000 family protein n=1 Tax=Bifidobacterium crudilactis TaxID=327277 RepID=UPI003B00B1EC